MTSKHAQQRLKILGFFADHSAAAACDAFDVSRRTLYRWKQCAKPAATRQP
ncbi:helix-turn-helix domain-containing protein [Candidatus Spongiihabitans sp.]|uniref:helix-turn-helix domain-containing protein n=1 Tax=Candidatus Spongiihabitans sp. TaxID=3101308 RepID=UPI003C704676